jgi:hypothetical protein
MRSTAPLLTSAALLGTTGALASPPCEGPAVVVDAQVGPAWRREIVDAIQRMRRLPDIDRCARVTVTPAGPDLRVAVALSDGRVTLRAVRDPAELRAWIDPLLIVPPRLDAPAAPAAPVAPVAPVAPSPPPRRPRLRLSLDTHARWRPGEALSFATGLSAGVVAGDWLLGASASMGDGAPFAIGVEAGRRLTLGDVSLDLLGAARLTPGRAAEAQSEGEAPSMRVGVGARAAWRVHPNVAPYAGLSLACDALGRAPAAPIDRLSVTATVGVAWE